MQRKATALGIAATVALALTIGARGRINAFIASGRARISQMLRLEQVVWEEVGTSNLSARVDKDLLWNVSGLKTGQEMLPLDMSLLEEKLLSIPWIESVQIQKKLPSTIYVRYTVHNARALGVRSGKLWSISDAGEWIAPLERKAATAGGNAVSLDLPVLMNEHEVATELAWLESLETALGSALVQVHELNFARERGSERYKATALVELQYASHTAKLTVVGAEKPDSKSLDRLKRVVQYLIKNNILVSTLDLRHGKKVVVNVGKRS